MSIITVANASAQFPVGTNVSAYPLKGFGGVDPVTGAPPGTAIVTAAVAASGELTLNNVGLTEGSYYLLAAEVGGVWKYMHVRVDEAGLVTVVATQATGDFSVMTAGKGFRVKEGANAKMGTATLVAGAVTVANTSVTANSRIFITAKGGKANAGTLTVTAKVAGTSFTIESSSGTDVREVDYIIFEPA